MSTSAIRKIWMLSRKPLTTLGQASANRSKSKKPRWTRGHPGELPMTSTTITRTTMVLTRAIDTAAPRDREPDRRGAMFAVGGRSEDSVTPGPGAPGSLEDRDLLAATDVGVVGRLPGAVGADHGQRLVHARGERAALLEQD